MSKPTIHRTIMQLKAREYITPNYVRLTFSGVDIEPYAKCTVGVNNKIFIPPNGIDKVIFPDKDNQSSIEELAIRRTYTHAGLNLEKKEIYMDFVAHGSKGHASNFAINAKIGASLGVAMKIQEIELVPEVATYCLIGDATAIPVIRAILQTIKSDSKGVVFLEVSSMVDRQELEKPVGVTIHWIINEKVGENTLLADTAITYFKEYNVPESRFAFVACEYNNVRKVRNYLRKDALWSREELSAYSYWKCGVTETRSETERRIERNSLLSTRR